MEFLHLCCSSNSVLAFSPTLRHSHTSLLSYSQPHRLSPSRPRLTANCRGGIRGDGPLSTTSAYEILGVDSGCSEAELKAAFRAKVKKYHPDVSRDGDSDTVIRRVIQAYQESSTLQCGAAWSAWTHLMNQNVKHSISLLTNFFVWAKKSFWRSSAGCPYPCVETAPQAFTFATSTGTARATSQGTGEDSQVQAAVGQCPRSCIHYVTPSQRIILGELLDSIMDVPYDTSAEADLLYSLIVKARFENNRYRKPNKQPRDSSEHVDWY